MKNIKAPNNQNKAIFKILKKTSSYKDLRKVKNIKVLKYYWSNDSYINRIDEYCKY